MVLNGAVGAAPVSTVGVAVIAVLSGLNQAVAADGFALVQAVEEIVRYTLGADIAGTLGTIAFRAKGALFVQVGVVGCWTGVVAGVVGEEEVGGGGGAEGEGEDDEVEERVF